MEKYKSHRGAYNWIHIPDSTINFVSQTDWPDHPEMVAEAMGYAKKCDEENKVSYEAYKLAYESFAKAFATMEETFERGSTKKKTKRAKLLEELRPRYPERCVQQVEDTLRYHRESKERANQERVRADAHKKREQLALRAAQFLNDHGYKLNEIGRWAKDGVEHKEVDVVSVANDVRQDEMIAEAKKVESCIEFAGNGNCEEGCSGWDMEERRCMCGHRRVSWEFNGDFTNMTMYAAAY